MPVSELAAIDFDAASLDLDAAAAAYREHGCLVVRGLMSRYVQDIRRDIEAAVAKANALYDQAEKVPEGWTTPDGTLWLPAPHRTDGKDRQIMVLNCRYTSSAAFFRSAWDDTTCDLAERVLGPDVELFADGQCLVKEPGGGHAKLLHQDASYFEHRHEGPMGVLCYAVDTDVARGALHVVPGSHRLGLLDHVDTESHLGLDPSTWTFDKALAVEGKAGDAIFFHVKTIHGSPRNNTDQMRPVFIHRYRAANDFVVVGASMVANRAKAEKLRDEATKENQQGLMVRGFRKHDPQ